VPTSHRAAAIICDIAKAHTGGFLESAEKERPLTRVSLRVPYLNKILGTAIKSADIRQTLLNLGCKVKGASVLDVTVPSYRGDITREADLIEEAVRVYGYDNINPVQASIVATSYDDAVKAFMVKRSMAKSTLVSSGFSEAVCYSLIGKSVLKGMLWADDDCVKIKNPLSKEQEIMRPSLLPGLIKAAAYNISRQVYDVKLFELSNIYFKKDKEYREEPCLALAVYEKAYTANMKGMPDPGFFLLKGVIANLAKTLGIKGLDFEKTTSAFFDEDYSLAFLSGNTVLGSMGRLKDKLASNFGIPGSLFAAEINFNQIILSARTQRYYKQLPRFPYTYRDISFAIDATTEYKQIELLVNNTAGRLVEGVELLSEYRGRQVEQGKKSLAIRVIFRSKEKTLSEEEITAADHDIRKSLEKTFNALLR
jgi:phenylalanyl-tRNA synthetase beta chain